MSAGEFGPIYERKEYNPDWEVQNQERYNMLDRQMAIYTSESIGRSPVTSIHSLDGTNTVQRGPSGPTKTSTSWA
jgi:hypothetical protein